MAAGEARAHTGSRAWATRLFWQVPGPRSSQISQHPVTVTGLQGCKLSGDPCMATSLQAPPAFPAVEGPLQGGPRGGMLGRSVSTPIGRARIAERPGPGSPRPPLSGRPDRGREGEHPVSEAWPLLSCPPWRLRRQDRGLALVQRVSRPAAPRAGSLHVDIGGFLLSLGELRPFLRPLLSPLSPSSGDWIWPGDSLRLQ